MKRLFRVAVVLAALLSVSAAEAEPRPAGLAVPPVLLDVPATHGPATHGPAEHGPAEHGPAPTPLELAPYAGTHNYAHLRRPFQWGWFGVERYKPLVHRHRGYYDQPIYWSNHRR